ncbi:MAG: type II toxin-antitoxin system RelE/ParE family toxin [Clostridium sp.]|uniref:type II toxin-antitoxin system RelE/ParE family toxin n=1 Tax=Niameybacter sp. TaxID=2033640 RepID=UPI002FCC07CF
MDKYEIKLLPKAHRDVDNIYGYIAKSLMAPETAGNIMCEMENAIFSLEEFPCRGSERKIGAYANKGYRQLFIKNFTIVYRIDESKKYVVIVTVKYTASQF